MSRTSESSRAPEPAQGALRRGALAGLQDIAKNLITWLAGLVGVFLFSLIPPVRAFLTTTSLAAWWMLPIGALGALAGAALERWLVGSRRMADLRRRIDALESENARLLEERRADRLSFRRELEEKIKEKTRTVLDADPRDLNARKWEQRLSLAALAIDQLDRMARELGAVAVDTLFSELEDCVIGEMRRSTDVLFRWDQKYWLVMPYQKQAFAQKLPERARVSAQLKTTNIPGLPRPLSWTISAGVAELTQREDVRDHLDEAITDLVDQAERALHAALQVQNSILTPDDIARTLPASL